LVQPFQQSNTGSKRVLLEPQRQHLSDTGEQRLARNSPFTRLAAHPEGALIAENKLLMGADFLDKLGIGYVAGERWLSIKCFNSTIDSELCRKLFCQLVCRRPIFPTLTDLMGVCQLFPRRLAIDNHEIIVLRTSRTGQSLCMCVLRVLSESISVFLSFILREIRYFSDGEIPVNIAV